VSAPSNYYEIPERKPNCRLHTSCLASNKMTRVGRQGSYPCLRLFVIIFSDIRVHSMKMTFCLFRLDLWLLFSETESYPEYCLVDYYNMLSSTVGVLIELLGCTTMTTYVSLKLLLSINYMYVFTDFFQVWTLARVMISHIMYMMSQPHTLRVTKAVTLYISRKTRKQWISACFTFYTWNNRCR
jgi:hypothetical protein